MAPMHALLVSLGSDGDVFPFIALGIGLRARGHRVTLAANEMYASVATARGFEFRPLVSTREMDGMLRNPDVWHPVRSALVGAKWARSIFSKQYQVIEPIARDPETVIVAYPPIFAARMAQEKYDRPLVSLCPMPWLILSNSAPPALPMAVRFPILQKPPMARLAWRLAEKTTDLLLGKQLNQLRRSLGLRPVRGIYRWCFSPSLTIGLFPDWYAPPQPDWPRNTRTAGFALYDGEVKEDMALREFCKFGSPPVVFTFGTGNKHAKALFKKSLQSCVALGMRGIFLTPYREQVPQNLPPTVRHSDYAPFSKLFPLCSGVVHHGGLGTTAQALAAGLPQLILPLAWDQPDNAVRVTSLGAGRWIPPVSSAPEIAHALAEVTSSDTRSRCAHWAGKFERQDPLEQAVKWIEEMARIHDP